MHRGATLRSPALHFVVVGLLLFVSQRYARSSAAGPEYEREPIVIRAARLEELRQFHVATVGEPPDAAAERYMIDREIDDELLYHEALAMGVDRADHTVFWHLVEKMKDLGEARPNDSDEQLFERAIALGLHAQDQIVRNILIRKLGMLLRFATHDDVAPDETELTAHYQRNLSSYTRPQSVTIEHVFFSRERRGVGAARDARAALELVSLDAGGSKAARLGDPFLSGHVFTHQTRDGLTKLFGPEFADEVMLAPEGSWYGPVRSAFGMHLVKVRDRLGGHPLPLESVRSRVLAAIEEERREARLRAKLAELRSKYEIRVEG